MTSRSLAARIAGALLVLASLSACGDGEPATPPSDPDAAPGRVDPAQVDSVELPALGACRVLTPDDVARASDATRTVACTAKHTAETYAVGQLPAELAEVGYDSADLGAFAYQTCSAELRTFLGADESLSLRTVLTWAWFRPSEVAWGKGARWYRCDVIGGSEENTTLMELPESARGLLLGRPDDKWLVCADGPSVNSSPKISCSQPHLWRAVTTIKLGEQPDDYPGDRAVEIKTRDFCSDSVGAYVNYPAEYEYGYTWFHEAEWDAGNRRSICWAKTSE